MMFDRQWRNRLSVVAEFGGFGRIGGLQPMPAENHTGGHMKCTEARRRTNRKLLSSATAKPGEIEYFTTQRNSRQIGASDIFHG
jgi:hypothetical protein